MANNFGQATVLPQAVEEAISRICREKEQLPLRESTRQALASSGEEKSLRVLKQILGMTIKYSFDGLLKCLLEKEPNINGSPHKRPSPPSSPLQSSQFSSPVKTTRLMNNSKGSEGLVQRTPPNTPPVKGTPLMMTPKGREDVQTPNTPPSTSNVGGEDRFSPQLVALGELEFRKAFLILNYIGKQSLEEKTTADKIRQWKDLAMDKFEEEVWFSVGQECISLVERCKSFEWESGKTYLYHCHVNKDGSCKFKGPYLDKSRNHLQRVLGDDNVLIVKFEEGAEGTNSKLSAGNSCYAAYTKIAKDGILVGLRRYRFFVFKDKDGGKARKKEKTSSPVKCIFVRFESNASSDDGEYYPLSGKTIQEARCVFMHVHTVENIAKYMARFSLILSGTMKLDADLADVRVEWTADELCRDKDGNSVSDKNILTDGTGYISEDLARKCPKSVYKGSVENGNHVEGNFSFLESTKSSHGDPPLIIQCRLFHNGSAVKGTLLVNKKLPPRTIVVRESMIKVKPDRNMPNAHTKNSLEVVATSNPPKRTCLSKYLIAVLSYGGVPDDIFMKLLNNALEESHGVFSSKRAALKVSLYHGGLDDFAATNMILSGIPLDEPHLQYKLSIMFNEERKGLLEGRIPVTDSFILMGTVDPSGVLETDEVSIILDNGQISGKVLVYRHPGLHFGDVRILNARYVEALNEFVGNSKYGIFFPCKGPRSLADQMAGGDYDGDTFLVSRNPQLLDYFKVSEPWIANSLTFGVSSSSSSKGLNEFSNQDLEDELFESFMRARFWPSHATGIAADSWMAMMDRFLSLEDVNSSEKEHVKKNLLDLVNIYYESLDAAKAGKIVEVPQHLKADLYPHYMERENSFKSTSILGKIYDSVKNYGEQQSRKVIVRKLPCFDVGFSVESESKWALLYGQYRKDMTTALHAPNEEHKEMARNEVFDKYKQELYGADELELSQKPRDQIYDEALAIYNICYDYAMEKKDVGKCGFAWKVAGSALLEFYVSENGGKTLPCKASVAVLKELFC